MSLLSARARSAAPILLAVALSIAGFAAPGWATVPQDSLRARVDRIFERWDRPGSPGCALGVVQDGRLVYKRGYGYANLDYGIPITPQTVFYIASVSKQFAAASIVLAARQGYLSLDDDIRKWIPELPDYGSPITIRHLIHHTSGLRDYLTLLDLTGRSADVNTDEEVINLIAQQKDLNFTPGTEYSYSNSGYFLLSQIIERATGQSLREFADEHLFRPLGMANTHFHDDPRHVQENRAVGYLPTDDGEYRIAVLANFDKVGDGGLYTTVEDLYLWDQNFYHNRLGGEGFVDQLLTRGVLSNGDTLDYAFALVHGDYKGLSTVEHGGSYQGYRTALLRFPEQRFSVILLCNEGTIDPDSLARQVADLYLADAFTESLAAYVGSYYSDELDTTYRLLVRDGHLVVQRPSVPDTRLTPQGNGAFRVESYSIRFLRDARGRVHAFALDAGRARDIRFTKIPRSGATK